MKGLTSVKVLTSPRHLSYVGHMAVMTQGITPQWTLSDKVRKAREYAGLSQQELAEQLSITRTSVINWERGHTRPLRALLVALADATGVDPAWLTYEGPETPVTRQLRDIPTGKSHDHEPELTQAEILAFRKRVTLSPTDQAELILSSSAPAIWRAAA